MSKGPFGGRGDYEREENYKLIFQTELNILKQ